MDPIVDMVGDLGARLSQRPHSDFVLSKGRARQFEIVPSGFAEITPGTCRRMAFVDGGSGTLYDLPGLLITINRTYYSIFEGSRRIKPRSKSRIQFFSYVSTSIPAGRKTLTYETRLFVQNNADKRYLPLEEDLLSHSDAAMMQPDRLGSLGRKFAEWQMAVRVVEDELEPGDMIVMDGSLQTGFENEAKYAERLYDAAMQKGVLVCGLSKTSRLVTESGEPLLARISEIAEAVPFGSWHVRLAEGVSPGDSGFIMAARFHEKSAHVFRFEILREQFAGLDRDGLNSVMYSLASNSRDVAMLGYPYGAIDADRFAQVRMDELGMYRGFVMSQMLRDPMSKRLQGQIASTGAHDILNRVSS